MQTVRLILLLLLILAAAVVVVVVLRRGSARKDDQRVEAAGLRSEAEGMAASVAGQDAFARQARERAEVARAEAEQRAREAARLEAEAAEQRAAAEATRREYEATMRRADDIDPDVRESRYPPLPVGLEPATTSDAGEPARRDAAAASTEGDGLPMTRAERRLVREQGDEDEGSRRVASGADFADEVPGPVYPGATAGSSAAMSHEHVPTTDAHAAVQGGGEQGQDLSHDAESPRGEWGGPPAEPREGAPAGASGVQVLSGTDDYASTEPLATDEQTPPVTASADSPDVEAEPQAEQDAADGHEDAQGKKEGEVAIVSDTDAFAATEPTSADGRASTSAHPRGHEGDERHEGDEERFPDDHAPAETGAAVAEPAADEGTTAEPAEERFDPTPSRDWASDEGELLQESHDRGERLAQERRELEAEAGDSTAVPAPAHGDGTASGHDVAPEPGAEAGRRISGFHELRDGGFGVGSAAPLDDRAQPLDHPVQAFRDSMTFRAPGDTDYDSAEPDVWFYDEGAAERSGFRRSDG